MFTTIESPDQAVLKPHRSHGTRRSIGRLFAGIFLGTTVLASPGLAAAADDGGGDFGRGTIGAAHSEVALGNVTSGLVDIQINAPSLYPATANPQSVRWAPIIQMWNGSKYVDIWVGAYSGWKSTGVGMFGPIPAPFAAVTKKLSLLAKGTYFFRVGYLAQWYWGPGNYSTARWMNRVANLYHGMAAHYGQPYFTYYRN